MLNFNFIKLQSVKKALLLKIFSDIIDLSTAACFVYYDNQIIYSNKQ